MFPQLSDSAKAFVFFALAFGLTILISLLSPLLAEATMFLHMFSPTLSVLLMMLVVTHDGYSANSWRSLGLHRAGFGSWGFAILGPLVMMSTVYGLVWGSGLGHTFMPSGYTLVGIPLEFIVQLVISSLFALGEEIGFRGYLLPRLTHLGTAKALLVSGLLHGLWHFPLMWLTPVYPVLGSWMILAPVILLTLTTGGVFFGYLQLTSKSVWPATVAHGTMNTLFTMFALFTVTTSPLALEYLAGETGVLTLMATSLTAIYLVHRLHQRRETLTVPLHPSPSAA